MECQKQLPQSPICTSYAEWIENHAHYPGLGPPGVNNLDGEGDTECCGGCVWDISTIQVMFSETKPVSHCHGVTPVTYDTWSIPISYEATSNFSTGSEIATLTAEPSRNVVVDGSTL